MHIVDVSGTTNEKGQVTEGYDPSNDIDWLNDEIHDWVFNNLWERWSGVTRRHVATKSSIAHTLQVHPTAFPAIPPPPALAVPDHTVM